MTDPVRRPRTLPPYKRPQRSSADGRIGASVADLHTRYLANEFQQFSSGAVGAEYGPHFEEWRRVFALHVDKFATGYDAVFGHATMLVNLQKSLKQATFPFSTTPVFTGRGADAFRLPFRLLLLVARAGYVIPSNTRSDEKYAVIAEETGTKAREHLLHGQETSATLADVFTVLAALKNL